MGPYEVVSRLGAGGMGVVYRARDTFNVVLNWFEELKPLAPRK